MQFDPQRAFPYPAFRPEVDDYIDGDFQVSVDFKPSDDGSELALEMEFAISIPEIANAIEAGDAKYVCVVSCRDTYFREAVITDALNEKRVFKASILRGEVQVFPYVVAVRRIVNFQSSLINPEFGRGPFEFKEGSVLALERPRVCYIDRDVFKPISSVFVIAKSDNLTGAEWRVDLSGSKVEIRLSPYMKEKVDIFRASSAANKAVLLNSIYFAAVMHCIRRLREADYSECRWAEVFLQRCRNYNIDVANCDEYEAAQRLLKNPLSLMDTYFFQGQEE